MKNIDWRSVLTAAGIGTILITVYNVINALLTRQLLGDIELTPANLGSEEVLAQLQQSQVVVALGCLLSSLILVGIGVLYAYLHQRNMPVSLEKGAAGGAIAAALANMVGTILGSLFQADSNNELINSLLGELPAEAGDVASILLIVGVVCGGLFALILGAITGALGGAVGGSIWNRDVEM